MKTLIADFVWSVIVVILLWSCFWIAASQAYQQPEYLYEPMPNSNRANIYKPRIYIDSQGNAWETYDGTFRADRSKPLPGRPKAPEPLQFEPWGHDWNDQ